MSAPKQIPTFLTAEEVGTILHRAPKTVYEWVAMKKIPCVKLPTGGVLFDADEIAQWIAQHKVEGEVKKGRKAA
jgi:predicted DNA-binding transcriptional regulator AlpA